MVKPGTARLPRNMVSYVWTPSDREQQAVRSSPLSSSFESSEFVACAGDFTNPPPFLWEYLSLLPRKV